MTQLEKFTTIANHINNQLPDLKEVSYSECMLDKRSDDIGVIVLKIHVDNINIAYKNVEENKKKEK